MKEFVEEDPLEIGPVFQQGSLQQNHARPNIGRAMYGLVTVNMEDKPPLSHVNLGADLHAQGPSIERRKAKKDFAEGVPMQPVPAKTQQSIIARRAVRSTPRFRQ